MLSIPPATPAQDSAAPEEDIRFKKEEISQMVASIALYPDSLIAQILMASTYPLEIVEAERWLRDNNALKGNALDEALKSKSWDPSVKSLCHFQDVLFAMSDKLDQTRKLGDAFLVQEDDVMATIQDLRRKAEEQGNLKSTKEQKVIVEREIIQIEPADPEVVYVPVYDPLYVYGPWWYPAYPPYYWYYPPGFAVTGGYIGFGPRVFVGFGLFSWAWFDWPVHRIHIDISKTQRFHRPHFRRGVDQRYWRHNPIHRRGVAYRDRRTSAQFGARPARVSPPTPGIRGFPGKSIEQRQLRGAGGQRDSGGSPGGRVEHEKIQRSPGRDTPFTGIGAGSFERRAGERGAESRRSGGIRNPARETRPQGGEMRLQGGGGNFQQRGDSSGRGSGSRR